MKTSGISPALIDFGSSPGDAPQAPRFGDIYHPRAGAAAQARHAFLQGNGLPTRWQGRSRFVVVETGFGLASNFLATWQAWREDPARCAQLAYVAVELHPPTRGDLTRAQQGAPWPELAAELCAAWPPLTAGVHVLDFEQGAVQLLLALGDVAELLPALRARADAFYLDGFAPARNPDMWPPRVLKALGRMAAPDATAATWSVAVALREGLATAGFDVQLAPGMGGKREITRARFAPRHVMRPLPDAQVPHARTAVVIGAGLAGAAAAQALAQQGLQVTVVDRHAEPAQETSGNPAGLFHGTVHGDDGHHARLFRAAALHAHRVYQSALAGGTVPGQVQGLLRLDERSVQEMQALLRLQGLPPDMLQALDADQASACAGIPLPGAAWLYAGGGWVAPPSWVRHVLDTPSVRFEAGAACARLERSADGWQVLGSSGQTLACAPIVVVANGNGALPLLRHWGSQDWPLHHTRGQVTWWHDAAASPLRMPVAGDGYAIALPGGGVLCGATNALAEPGAQAAALVTAEDHAHNLHRLQRMTGIAPAPSAALQGRTGWRLHTDDRLPIAGALPALHMPPGQRMDQPRLLPREAGLFVLTALGSRGLTLAPLLARLIAAQATGSPWPLEQDLADAVDPARWRVRAARRQTP